MDTCNSRLLVFAREPGQGKVKTRLIPVLGEQTATAIYRRLLSDTLRTAAQYAAARCELWADRLCQRSELVSLAGYHGMSVHLQQGDDLGSRMHAALRAALQRSTHAVLIGTDCPEYDTAYLGKAFAALERHDAVLGPAADGGYALIGLKQPARALFDGIPWGSDRVLATTRRRLRETTWSWYELPTLHDVDEPADLCRFPRLAGLAGIDFAAVDE
jgi:rSAM/selenodomain-associated transferase 1